MAARNRRLTIGLLVSFVSASAAGLAAPAAAAPADTYYVSAHGDDALSGTSPATAWRTLSPVNSRALAGDTVLLEGGSTFVGPLSIDSGDDGLTVGSFGTGRARILGQGTNGVIGYDASHLTLRDLDLVGDSSAFTSKGGLSLYSDRPASQRLTDVTVSNVSVEGFKNGIEIGGANPAAGFADVKISNVEAVGNRDAGIITYGPAGTPAAPSYANAAVRIVHSVANQNLGNAADTAHNSGNGIVLGSVDGGSILHSSASGNGTRCAAPEGPAGIWTYDSRAVRIAYNTATGNHTAGTADGDGFDLDINVTDSVLAHNTSADNDGAGFLVYGDAAEVNRDNVVRWNTSRNDAQKSSWYGGITLAGKVQSVTVTRNTVDTGRSPSGAPALAIKPDVSRAHIAHNVLQSAPDQLVISRS